MKYNYWKRHYFVMDVDFCFSFGLNVCFVFQTRGKQIVTSFSFRAPSLPTGVGASLTERPYNLLL